MGTFECCGALIRTYGRVSVIGHYSLMTATSMRYLRDKCGHIVRIKIDYLSWYVTG
jgi:hypothetical protein